LEEVKFAREEEESYSKLLGEIDSELKGLITLFNGFFQNEEVITKVNQIVEFNLKTDITHPHSDEFMELIDESYGGEKMITRLTDEVDEKLLSIVEDLNREITKEMRKSKRFFLIFNCA